MKDQPESLGLIAGNGSYPVELINNARRAGVKKIFTVAFIDETDQVVGQLSDDVEWLRVGQLGKLLKYFSEKPVDSAIMAGQISPGSLFDLRPDLQALVLLGTLKERNAESIFGAIAAKLDDRGVRLLPATSFMSDQLAQPGPIAGPKPSQKELQEIEFGLYIAKQISALDIGQTVVVRAGTVLAVEGFDGTNSTIKRGGKLGRGRAIVCKVSKPGQDLRFDVPVVGKLTLETAAEAGVRFICVEAYKTLFLQQDELMLLARQHRIGIYGACHE